MATKNDAADDTADDTPDAVPVRSASYVRDHLANERTFLAWLRTAVAMMGFGIVMVKLRYLVPNAPATGGVLHVVQLGLLFAGVGLAMVPFALWHYFSTRRAIDGAAYVPEGASVVAFGVAIMVVGVGVIIYLLTPQPVPVVPAGANANAVISHAAADHAAVGRNSAVRRVLCCL